MPPDPASEPSALLLALLSWALVAGAFLLPAVLVFRIPRPTSLHAAYVPAEQGAPPFLVVVAIVVLAFSGEAALGGALARGFADEWPSTSLLWWLLVAKLAVAPLVFLAAVLVQWFTSLPGVPQAAQPAQLGLSVRQFRANVLLGYVGWLVVTPIVLAVFWLSLQAFVRTSHPVETVLKESPGLATWLVVLSSVLLAAPLAEELVFRGVVQPWLVRQCHRALARTFAAFLGIAATSVCFAAIHPWPTPIPLFLLSLALGWLRYRTGSLVAPITAHILFNFVGLLPFILRQTGAW